MEKRIFTREERFTVFVTYDECCYLCNEPLSVRSTEIDHVIPEHLLEKPVRLSKVLEQLGLASDFNIQDFGNWMPICGPCNKKKLGRVFKPSLLFQNAIEVCQERADKARTTLKNLSTSRRTLKALESIHFVPTEKLAADKYARDLIEITQAVLSYRASEFANNVVMLTPTINMPIDDQIDEILSRAKTDLNRLEDLEIISQAKLDQLNSKWYDRYTFIRGNVLNFAKSLNGKGEKVDIRDFGPGNLFEINDAVKGGANPKNLDIVIEMEKSKLAMFLCPGSIVKGRVIPHAQVMIEVTWSKTPTITSLQFLIFDMDKSKCYVTTDPIGDKRLDLSEADVDYLDKLNSTLLQGIKSSFQYAVLAKDREK
jgi:5-methylcytosine-specific restriction endonuclease McrA